MYSHARFSRLISVAQADSNRTTKGRRLERALSYLFSHLDGVKVKQCNINLGHEEVDILLLNTGKKGIFAEFDAFIKVECKNWSSPMDAKAVRDFIHKVRERHGKTGIIISANGVTGEFSLPLGNMNGALFVLHNTFMMDKIRIIVLTMDDLTNITCLDHFVEIIEDRICAIYTGRLM